MRVSALASGSSGNCFYVENSEKNKSILIDAGITCKQIEERLANINRSPKMIKAVFLTHEHSDHVKGVDVFARKFNVPIFATRKMINEAFLCSDKSLLNDIKNNESMKIIGLRITAFPKSHKALDPVSFSINSSDKHLSIITDAGYPCENIITNVENSNFLCIESNYDEKMLEESRYPWHVKRWIGSNEGHMSNLQSASCVLEHSKSKLKNLMLCHISQNNNTPEKALETYDYMMKQRSDIRPKITVSLRSCVTSLMKV